MVESEREMLREAEDNAGRPAERSTSLQSTYEDSVPPAEHDWELEDV